MKKQPKVSIVVPIYGVEKYLHQCVDSILAQTLTDIEIILVDDGSKDKCPQIVDEYAKKDPRVVAIHQPNGGYGKAVNHGIKVATGEYIGIVESDDWIAEDMYEKLYNKATETNVDIVKSSFYDVKKSNDRSKDKINTNIQKLSNLGIFNLTEHPEILSFYASIWSSIYRNNLIKDIKFVEDLRPYEDLPFIASAYAKAKSITVIDYAGYYYRTDATSSSNNTIKPTIVNYITQRGRYRDNLIKYNVYDANVMEIYWLQTYRGLKCFFDKPNNKYRKIYYRKMQSLFNKAIDDGCKFTKFNKDQYKDFHKIIKKNYLLYTLHKLFYKKNDTKKNRTEFVFFGIKLSIKKYKINFNFACKILDILIPKNKNKIIFISNPDFSDNSKEYYEYLQSFHKNEYNMIWLYSKKDNQNYSFINKKYYIYSIKGLFHLLSSKYIISTWFHGNNLLYMKKHTVLQLWHGMPLKTLGYNEKNINKNIYKQYRQCGKNAYFFVSSDIFKLSMIASFLMKSNKIFITGQSKTDCILTDRNRKEISEYINYSKYDKVVIYAPTYKEAKRNKRRDINKKFENIFYFDDYNENSFYNLLEEKNILFIIKPHPFDEPFYKEYKQKITHQNIKIVFDEDMKENNFYFYEFFSFADLMITDFSSIAIDYLINKKPVIFLNALSEQYNKNRGFILEDNYEILMPGAKASNFNELTSAIIDALTTDSWKEKREQMIPLLHKYCDSNASERIYNIMKGLK